MNAIPEIPIGIPIQLRGHPGLPDAVHEFDETSAWAVRSALAARRPLLVRGEPGTGKSQLARAAAVALDRVFISEAMHARSESQDLLWRYDAVARLGEAQTLSAESQNTDTVRAKLAPLNYLSPGPLWWVFNWDSAKDQHTRAGGTQNNPIAPEGWSGKDGAVLLIDEIDKAEADLPNGLLDTLGNGSFCVPWLNDRVGMKEGTPSPLVVITTNEERDLPAAFLRRCMVLNLFLPQEKDPFMAWIIHRGRLHFGGQCLPATYTAAAEQLWRDRVDATDQGLSPPGQAEYIDMLRVLVSLEPNVRRQKDVLKKIQGFALRKHPPEQS